MVMVPDDYRTFISTLRAEVDAGRVPLSRIDDAVTRILTKKFELGLFEQPYADRSFTASVGAAAHRDVARRAVRESLVLLKNDNRRLPLAKSTPRIFVAGKSADDLGNQAGGWTISWQGASGATIPGTSILQAIRNTVAPGTTVTYSRRPSHVDRRYDVAIVVVGETPYAEGAGDRTGSLGLDAEDLRTLSVVKRAGLPTVVVLVSGRPMNVTSQLPDWSAFIAAWLPGSEGQGVADVLFGDYAPTGTLPMSWPRSESQIPINVGDAGYDPLFPYGFGLGYR
jgi:beta-glucosidase